MTGVDRALLERISFHIEGTPFPWQRARVRVAKRNVNLIGEKAKPVFFTSPQDKAWRGCVRIQAMSHRPPRPFEGPIEVTLLFSLPIPKSWPKWKRGCLEGKLAQDFKDLDNYEKSVLDALTGIFWKDDHQIAIHHSRKRYAPDPRLIGVDITIVAYPPYPERLSDLKED